MNDPRIWVSPVENLDSLTERLAADRKSMAAITKDFVDHLGAEESIIRPGHLDKHEICVDIHVTRGLRVSIDFAGKSEFHRADNTFVLSWYFDSDSDTCLADAFGDINPYHFRKGTQVARGMENLLSCLKSSIDLAASGAAFDEARTAAHALEMIPRRAAWKAYMEERDAAKAEAA
jgi:hypothetical protein